MTQDISAQRPDRQQVYDTTLKSLLTDHPQDMLSFLLAGATYQTILSETAPKPPLRVDGAILALYRNEEHVIHAEFETDADSDMPKRMLEYYGILYRKYDKPIIPIVICPFRTNIVDGPLRIMSGDERILELHYKVFRLWLLEAQQFLETQRVSLYALLPSMKGTTCQQPHS